MRAADVLDEALARLFGASNYHRAGRNRQLFPFTKEAKGRERNFRPINLISLASSLQQTLSRSMNRVPKGQLSTVQELQFI